MTQSHAANAANFLGTPKSNEKDTTGNLAKTPRIPPLEKSPPEEKHETTIRKFHVKVAFTVPEDDDILRH
eukprot:621509-Ditylum_brightwellii.AAC.1